MPLKSENGDNSASSFDKLPVTNKSSFVGQNSERSNHLSSGESPAKSRVAPRSPLLKSKSVYLRRPRKFGVVRGHSRPSSLKDPRLQEWSQSLLKDFQNIVEEELKSLNFLALENEVPVTSSNSSSSINSIKYVIGDHYQQEYVGERKRPSSVTEGLMKDASRSSGQNLNGGSLTNVDLKMGANQSAVKVPENWEDDFFAPYKTYTLPRSHQRSVSLVGERLASSGHPDDRSESCKLISVTHHRFSRSLSLDEGRVLSPWAMEHLHLIDKAHCDHDFTPNPDISLPEGIYGKIRKTGISQADNEKLFINIHANDSPLQAVKRLSNGWMTPHDEMTSFANERALFAKDLDSLKFEVNHDSDKSLHTRHSSITSGTSSALTVEALGERDCDGWVYADEDVSCLLPDRFGEVSASSLDTQERSNGDCSVDNPEIVITSPDINSKDQIHNSTKTLQGSDFEEDGGKPRKLRQGSGRRSEPSFPSQGGVPASPLLSVPGLELRRHTLPNPANKNGAYSNADSFSLDSPGTPIFNTSSWETLPPAEEMEVMENKPIQMDETQHLSLERPSSRTKSITSSRSLNSSLSSLSQLSYQDEFSENELWSPCSKSPDSKSSNSVDDLLVESTFSPDVFLDPSRMYFNKNTNDFLNNLNKDRDPEEDSLKGVFVDTKPVIIKLSPKIVKDVRKPTDEDLSDTRKVFHETHSSLLKNILVKETDEHIKEALKDKDIKSFKDEYEKSNNTLPTTQPEPLSGVLHLTPDSQSSSNELIFTVTVSESSPAENQCSEMGVESDSCNNTLDRRKGYNDPPSPTSKDGLDDEEEIRKNFESIVIAEKKRFLESDLDDPDFLPSKSSADSKKEAKKMTDDLSDFKADSEHGNNDGIVLPPVKQTSHGEKRKKNSKGKSCNAKGVSLSVNLTMLNSIVKILALGILY